MPAPSLSSTARIAFSYERVSNRKQAGKGKKGIARQHEDFAPFCERHGLTPNPDPIRDEGLSAYHAKHFKKGNLGGFIKAAQDKKIPWGSVLVVEDWSRFSRRKASYSHEMLGALWSVGCALAWVREDVVITREKFDEDQVLRIKLDMAMQAAHDFSKGLSKTNSQVWNLREQAYFKSGTKYLSMASAPDWVRVNDDKTDFEENERADWMREIFRLRTEGMGAKQIALAMNELGRTMSGGGSFSEGRIGRVLRDRRLIGEKAFRSGRVARGYFPRVIGTKLWETVQALVDEANPGGTGRGDFCHNILQGLTRCTCGGTLTWQGAHKDKSTGQYRYSYLICMNQRNHTCTAPKGNWKYDEELLIHALMDARWEDLFDTPRDTKQIAALQSQLKDQESEIDQLKQTVDNNNANLATAMGLKDFDAEAIKLMTGVGKAAKKTLAKAQAAADEISRRIEVLSLAPSGEDMKEEVLRRTKDFLANLEDKEQRRAFNNWANTLGVVVEITHTGQMRFMKDGGVEQLDVYREGDTIVLDQTRHDSEVLGVKL
ncbi:recombinase family protein [Synechococcus sp. A15-28]|uniref:recombinase family protein n=1 Tax=Synechococcus sp. A15-28 TaxID=1050638 RepID=UPI001644934B|nr:recombinase family protein [Synechococcus sp. A15-28]QNI42993.1 hypothetical protein SynA1528_01971 [Synechococcus sp. A15-28]